MHAAYVLRRMRDMHTKPRPLAPYTRRARALDDFMVCIYIYVFHEALIILLKPGCEIKTVVGEYVYTQAVITTESASSSKSQLSDTR